MALLTFLSDFGDTDHYVAAVKARILSVNPNQQIVDISHRIPGYNLAHASYVLASTFREFPSGTVHLCGVNAVANLGETYIALKLEGHYFVGVDNGLFSLISEEEPELIVDLACTEELQSLARSTTFPTRDMLAAAACKLASGTAIEELGEPLTYINRMLPLKPRATKKLIAGHVVHIDHYGNLHTNIQRLEFESLLEESFYVKIGREKLWKIQRSYAQSDPGDLFCLFNSQGLLEIGIHSGNASELMNMHYQSPIMVYFVPKEQGKPQPRESPLFS